MANTIFAPPPENPAKPVVWTYAAMASKPQQVLPDSRGDCRYVLGRSPPDSPPEHDQKLINNKR